MSRRIDHSSGLGCAVPADWEIRLDPAEGTAYAVLEAPREIDGHPAFRANLVATVGTTGGLGFRDWQAGTDELLPRVLADYQLIDLEKLTIDRHPGGRRLAHHASEEAGPLTMEQWFALVDGTGYTLTATVDTGRYDGFADLFAQVAATIVLPRSNPSGNEEP